MNWAIEEAVYENPELLPVEFQEKAKECQKAYDEEDDDNDTYYECIDELNAALPDDVKQQLVEELYPNEFGIWSLISIFDIILMIFALGTAYKVGSGND